MTNFPLGVAVAVDGNANLLSNQQRQTIVSGNFSQISAENQMKMSYYNESTFANPLADQMISWAKTNNLSVHGHALVWHPDYQQPSWAKNPGSDFKTKFINHVRGVATKHKGQVVSWDVVNEALYDPADAGGQSAPPQAEYYRHSVFHNQYNGPSYIVEAFKTARQADPTAELYYNDFNTEENGNKTTGLVNLITYLKQQQAPIDGVGFQMHVLPDWASMASIEASWQKIINLDPRLKIKLTELDVRVNNKYSNPPKVISSCNNCPELQQQKQRYKDIIAAYYRIVPADRRGGITIWGIADPDSWFASDPDWPLLWNASLQPKPAFDGVKEALQAGQ